MYSSLRGRSNPLNTDIISSLQISQHHYRHCSITLDVAISTQTLRTSQTSHPIADIATLYRLRALNVETALAMISHHDRLVSSIMETSL
jgi:hypothetical protein